jgi:hypothetical protein
MMTYEARVHHLVLEGLRFWIRTDKYSLKLLDLDPCVKITQKLKKYQKEHFKNVLFLKFRQCWIQIRVE